MLDTTLKLETPEGTEVDVHPAGPFVRGSALLVDELIRWALIAAVAIPAASAGAFGGGLLLLWWFLVSWFYGVVFEVFFDGATPGKRLRGLAVVHSDGTPVGLPASLARNLLLVVDFLPAFYVLGLIVMNVDARFRRLGDLVGGTMVVHRSAMDARDFESPRGQARAVPLDAVGNAREPPVALAVEEQGAFIEFLERCDRLSDDRVRELALILAPALGATGAAAVDEVRRVAQGIRNG